MVSIYINFADLESKTFMSSMFVSPRNEKQSWKARSGPYAGSGWENPDRWSARNKPIRFEDLGFRTTEMLQKKGFVSTRESTVEMQKIICTCKN